MRNVAIVGLGRLGGALAIALSRAGYHVSGVLPRNPKNLDAVIPNIEGSPVVIRESGPIEADIIIIATQDGEIAGAAARLADRIAGRPVVFHTSGSLSSDELSPLQGAGLSVGSLHPLASVSDPVLGAERFAGAYFCVEGDPEAVETATAIVHDLGGHPFSVETRFKALYHASAVTACGHLVALLDASFEMLGRCGLSDDQAKTVLLPLIESTITNLKTQSPPRALTGTFARADVRTFERHLASIDGNVSEEIRQIYLLLGERSLSLALEQGANAADIEEIRGKILLAKSKSKC